MELNNLDFKQAYRRLLSQPGPLFATAGQGFGKLLGCFPVQQLCLHQPGELLNLEWYYPNHLILVALGFEFATSNLPGELPLAEAVVLGAWVRFTGQGAVIEGPDPEARAKLLVALEAPEQDPNPLPLGLREIELDLAHQETGLAQIFGWIKEGQVYQLNYTQTLKAQTQTKARDCFLRSLEAEVPAYAALFEGSGYQLLSLSPELFLQTQGDRALTRPIKGTRPRGQTEAQDRFQAQALLESPKEGAELAMITDLLRNDLGKISRIGSVQVTEPRALSFHPEVIHTHARIESQLKPPYFGLNALLQLLPGGSVSGCPKARAVELIGKVEKEPRGFYTGTLGYRLPGGDLCFTLLIRTLVFSGSQVGLGVGGGITLDSDPAMELAEARKKADSVLKRFEAP
ncbi:MAG: hypothetical protein A2600_05080 [Candidatus Lambdaproteobacteria bacterium RIFOXYD1_FULL_56_27]|uniref:Chorismate-utilising enzyme C-terminal domain-containing protein n=1 Tax=Candidatus Lambdaproteobacteria bacterium RIFOXYD2_FULL_56_26 TaxID=1817773 RepID=A0A1F6GRV8_9PROT|nr:MAG: hypothetical protein A2426_07935 [Candidatus Lambdaproteobacteria bacterium RIFOXYC1_FULL_56_13]OGH00809.1 MAG: hypothetical protein A2557_03805 [Candidatus Lambdaproteobacteria bacterium RIFOXYD2_FULL_56_26]OGH09926.1 MAG: hypothetical protein A2600_05080 [Candidatus Lambdaproteobacteria bacterium RIFOXYD1_FULL_56_27]